MEFARQLKDNIDIVQVVREYVPSLKKAGTRWVGLCPFHQEKTPSFGVRHQFYKCFGCGAGGDLIKFVMEMEGLTFWEASKQLAERYGIPLPKRMDAPDEESRRRAALFEMHEIAQKLYRAALDSHAGEPARNYLAGRGVKPALASEFGLGLSDPSGQALTRQFQKAGFSAQQMESSGLVLARNDGSGFFDRFRGRLMFPIHNESGKIIAFAGRAGREEDQPKYLNSSETAIYKKSHVLYNFHRARKAVRQSGALILVEGYMDVIGLHGAGVEHAVASCGTALTPSQARMMRRHSENVVVNFDPDPAGAAAAERSIQLLLEEGLHVRVLTLPGGLDPDEFIQENGVESYRELAAKAPRYFEWLADRARERFDMRSAEGRVAAFKFLLPAIQNLPDKIERAAVADDVAAQLGVDKGLVLEQFRKLAVQRSPRELKPAPVEMPPNERLLIRCLLESEEARAAALPVWNEKNLPAQPATTRILRAISALQAGFSYEQLDARLEDDDRTLLARLVFADTAGSESDQTFVGDHTAAQAIDCLRVLEEAERETQRTNLKARIANAERQGNLDEALRLSQDLERMDAGARRRRPAGVE
ncbi:MAG: DNA primase [Acidimicrobiia bacterium]|nr:DNA primase [Acidimicrobiia bacterium]